MGWHSERMISFDSVEQNFENSNNQFLSEKFTMKTEKNFDTVILVQHPDLTPSQFQYWTSLNPSLIFITDSEP